MYWKTENGNYLVCTGYNRFSCWDDVTINDLGTFSGSSSFLELTANGEKIKCYGNSVSTSISEEFIIDDIHLVLKGTLYQASFKNFDLRRDYASYKILEKNLEEIPEHTVPQSVRDAKEIKSRLVLSEACHAYLLIWR